LKQSELLAHNEDLDLLGGAGRLRSTIQ
jgi:hypothetical protein